MIRIGMTALALTLGGCMMDAGGMAPTPVPGVECNANPAQRLVGKAATPALTDRARRLSGAATARRITPEMRVTMEFRADRVNVWVGIDGKAERISCG